MAMNGKMDVSERSEMLLEVLEATVANLIAMRVHMSLSDKEYIRNREAILQSLTKCLEG